MKRKVLFLCTENSCRSQMAEGIMRHLYGGRFEVFSAGTKPTSVNPMAIKVMAEIGIDISKNEPKSVQEFVEKHFDIVLTTCSDAKENCPVFPGKAHKIHWNIEDPTEVRGSEEERLSAFRCVRDEIKLRVVEEFGT